MQPATSCSDLILDHARNWSRGKAPKLLGVPQVATIGERASKTQWHFGGSALEIQSGQKAQGAGYRTVRLIVHNASSQIPGFPTICGLSETHSSFRTCV